MKPFSVFSTFGCLVLLFFALAGCSSDVEAPIGTDIETPLTVVGFPNGSGFYVLNASTMASYSTGSVLKVGFDAQGNMVKGNAFVIPRLAMDSAISEDGNELAIAFSGATAGIRFVNTSNPDSLSFTGQQLSFSPDTLVAQMRYLTVAGQRLLLAQLTSRRDPNTDNRPADTKVMIWKLVNGTYVRAAMFPDDINGLIPTGMKVGFGSPFYLENEQLLGMVPQGWEGLDKLRELNPDCEDKNSKLKDPDKIPCQAQRILDFLQDPKGRPVPDYIASSLIAFDLAAWLGGTPIEQAYAVLPVFYGNAALAPNLTLGVKDPRHDGLAPRFLYGPTQGISGASCTAGSAAYTVEASLGELPNNSAYVYYKEILRFTGWSAVKAAMATDVQPSTPENRFTSRILPGKLQFDVYSKTINVPLLNRVASSVSQFARLDMNPTPKCAPVWLRLEGGSPRGYEISRLSFNEGLPPQAPSLAELPVRGGYALATVGERVVVASYSRDELVAYELGANQFKVVSRLR